MQPSYLQVPGVTLGGLQALGDEHAQVLRRQIKDRLKQDPGHYYGETILLLCQLQIQSEPGQCSADDARAAAV